MISFNTFQGHRGARGLLPENTIPAFLHCLSLGINTLELDLVISQDKQVIVSHESWFNPSITTLPNGQPLLEDDMDKYRLYQMLYEQIKQFDCGLRQHPHFPKQQPIAAVKPTLAMVVKSCEEYVARNNLLPVIYNLEIKCFEAGDKVFHPIPPEYVQLVYQTIQTLGIENQCIVQSFDKRILRELKKVAPALPLSLLIENFESFEKNITNLGFLPNIYAPAYTLITKDLVDEVHQKGLKIFAWTVNKKVDMKRLLAYGVDSIITDYPNLAKEVVL